MRIMILSLQYRDNIRRVAGDDGLLLRTSEPPGHVGHLLFQIVIHLADRDPAVAIGIGLPL